MCRSRRYCEFGQKIKLDRVAARQPCFAVWEKLLQPVRAITYFGYAEILAPTAVSGVILLSCNFNTLRGWDDLWSHALLHQNQKYPPIARRVFLFNSPLSACP